MPVGKGLMIKRQTDGNVDAPGGASMDPYANDHGEPEPDAPFYNVLALCKCTLQLYEQPKP